MNYLEVYELIINKYRQYPANGYVENHHIIPRCIGGTDHQDNLVKLPARAHFVAHLLLARIYGGNLIIAAFLMSKDGRHGNRKYEWLRVQYSKRNSQRMMGNKMMLGKKASLETRQKLSVARMGNTNAAGNKGNTAWNKGKTISEETKEKIRRGNLGQKRSAESKARCSAAQMGNKKGAGKLGKKYGKNKFERSVDYRNNQSIMMTQIWAKRKLAGLNKT